MRRSELQNNLAMTVALVSGGMLFLTLFMGYAVYRTSLEAWPPAGVTVSLWLPLVSTVLIGFSSWCCYQLRLAAGSANWSKARKQLALTAWLGFGFMLSQAALWFSLKTNGLYVSSGVFASILYGFTWIHAVHVVGALAALLYLVWHLRHPNQRSLQLVINVEKFWHFLGLVWVFMFLGIFVF